MIRVLLVDDDNLVRAGLAMILDATDDIKVVGEAGSGSEAIEAVRRLSPDVVLMDIRMPNTDGIEATRRIVSTDGAPKVIIVTTFEADDYVFESLRAGAGGFLLKRTPPRDLIAGIRSVASGDALLAPSVTRRLIERFALQPDPGAVTDERLELLTDREKETLVLVARGLNNAELAEAMYVSESTAKTHLRRILMKLSLRDRVAAVIFAYESGILRSGNGSDDRSGR